MSSLDAKTDSTAQYAGDGVIVNRHLSRDWNTFLIPGQEGRTASLCGRRVLKKYTGIPGITQQPRIVDGREGWCPVCMKNLLEWFENTYEKHPQHPYVQQVYDLVFWEMFMFMKNCIDEGLLPAVNVQNLT